jgi:hypothetical protein
VRDECSGSIEVLNPADHALIAAEQEQKVMR